MNVPAGITALKKAVEYVEELARLLKAGEPLRPLARGRAHVMIAYTGKVVSKGRPRMGKHSVYTPTETRDFEKAVKEAAKQQMAMQNDWQITGAVEAELVVYDAMPEKWPAWMKMLATSEYIFKKDRADLDNRAKSILDSLNGVVYKDDNQITKLTISRRYSRNDGFRVAFYKLGLSANVLANLKKLMD